MTPELRRELRHLFEVEAKATQDSQLEEEIKNMSTEEKKEDLEIGGLVKMSTLKKLFKVGLVLAAGFFIGRKTA